jgi:hypothetical protein
MTDDVSVDLLPYTSHSALLGLILDKCTDVAARYVLVLTHCSLCIYKNLSGKGPAEVYR